MNEIVNIGPLQAPQVNLPTPLPDTHNDRVAQIRSQVNECLKKAGKDMPVPPDLKIPKPGEEPEDPIDILKLAEVRKRAALLPPIEDSNAFLGRPIAKPPVLIEGLLKQKRITAIP